MGCSLTLSELLPPPDSWRRAVSERLERISAPHGVKTNQYVHTCMGLFEHCAHNNRYASSQVQNTSSLGEYLLSGAQRWAAANQSLALQVHPSTVRLG